VIDTPNEFTLDFHPAGMSTLFTNALKRSACRQFHTRTALRYPAGLENILGGGPAPPVQVKSIGEEGIQLADGLVIPSACIFLDGQVFLWNVPSKPWKDWTKEHFRIFDVVVPKPGEESKSNPLHRHLTVGDGGQKFSFWAPENILHSYRKHFEITSTRRGFRWT
jgi:hypothetical protein